MNDDTKVVFKTIFTVVGSVLFIGFAVMMIANWYSITFVHKVPIHVIVDGKEVYHGIDGCVSIVSSGANTSVEVNGGFLCLFPKAYYTSRNVRVTPD